MVRPQIAKTEQLKMKTMSLILGVVFVASHALSADKIKQGPSGGRVLEKVEPTAEFVVAKDRTAVIRFHDAALKPVEPAQQTVTLIATPKAGKQVLEFEKRDGALVSTKKLPEGDPYPVVLQFRKAPSEKPQNFRFNLDLSLCGGCKLAEYACACHD
jgi:hypothetical protein